MVGRTYIHTIHAGCCQHGLLRFEPTTTTTTTTHQWMDRWIVDTNFKVKEFFRHFARIDAIAAFQVIDSRPSEEVINAGVGNR